METGPAALPFRLLLPFLILAVLPFLQADKDLIFDSDGISKHFDSDDNLIFLDSNHRVKKQVDDYYDDDVTTELPDDNYFPESSLDNGDDEDEEEERGHGSGDAIPTLARGPNKEKVIRVSFTMKEPCIQNINSPKWQNLSRGLADAVNELYDHIDGDQSAKLVKLETIASDNFTCKAFLDIHSNTNNFDEIVSILQRQISERGRLKNILVSDKDFTYKPSNVPIEIETSDGNIEEENSEDRASGLRCDNHVRCGTSDISICEDQQCDGVRNCPDGEDEAYCTPECQDDEMACDGNKCIPNSRVCDGVPDCNDNLDEANCDCLQSEFKCDNGDCIPNSYKCNKVFDCIHGEDEQNCPCNSDEFQCRNGECIEGYRRCDKRVDCDDGSDEESCPINGSNITWTGNFVCHARRQFMCADGSCLPLLARCNGMVDCPKDSADEMDCPCKSDQWQCDYGSCISRSKKCDGHVDCPTDHSDERNCFEPTCREEDFLCNDGTCIPYQEKCNSVVNCLDGSDEENCPPKVCELRCSDGQCLDASKRCDRTLDCSDGADEQFCDDNVCSPGELRCGNGECFHREKLCDGVMDCGDNSDEYNCTRTLECAADEFRCDDGDCIEIGYQCDNSNDCNDGSDEENCPVNNCPSNQFLCDGRCRDVSIRCDNNRDCADDSDESNCPRCQPGEHMCRNRQCIPFSAVCDLKEDCSDGSDEEECLRESLQLITVPSREVIKQNPYNSGGDVVFQCRDESQVRAPVKWMRADGKALPFGTKDEGGRLEMPNVQVSDSGEYICQAQGYSAEFPGSRLFVQLTVEPYQFNVPPPIQRCQLNEATCANGECIPKSGICDGRQDCSDRSDEINCEIHGSCEPNEFKCANKKCISKNWLCDSEDDCKDGSDEAVCEPKAPGALCHSYEFKCLSNNQCIPKSYHCDKENDCSDMSDEIGCISVSIIRPPPAQVTLFEGSVFTITCTAIGVPTPQVVWRRNWGHIPEKCSYTSVNGFGTLTCPNIQIEDQGAYSCEAINNQGTAFGIPDTILIVNRTNTNVCPPGYFNSEARSSSECISCFCFGATTQCHSANLFTYQLPLPFSPKGLAGVVHQPGQPLQITYEPITDIFDFRPRYAGANITRSGAWSPGNIYPYLALPESYHGSQLTSYGGYIKYIVRPHGNYPPPNGYTHLPDVILKNGDSILIHKINQRLRIGQENEISVRLFQGPWEKVTEYGSEPATREDIMMVLANVDEILLRAEEWGSGVEIMNFQMDSAKEDSSGQGLAAFVEECSCPSGYSGLSCQKCSPGFYRVSSGNWLGQCKREEPECAPGYYGNVAAGIPCKPCPCPMTNSPNQFASTCSLESDGQVTCNCPTGYVGRRCEKCDVDYVGNPLAIGDYCRYRPQTPAPAYCDSRGTLREDNGRCQCKKYASGPRCSECSDNSFHLSSNNLYGCSRCFCMGITKSCGSSTLRRKTVNARFGSRFTLEMSNIRLLSDKYTASLEKNIDMTIPYNSFEIDSDNQEVSFSNFSDPNEVYYWSMPDGFIGDKVTSYGGIFAYKIRHIPSRRGQNTITTAADIQLVSKKDMTFVHYSKVTPDEDGYLTYSVPIIENYWERTDHGPSTRDQLLLALADVKYIFVKATYTIGTESVSFVSASIDMADERATGIRASEVEQCKCPEGYIGTSCEDCAPGYTRTGDGIYLGFCGPCNCNGHSDQCHPHTGDCMNCQHNTVGKNCDECAPGYEGDATLGRSNSCQLRQGPNEICRCDPRGTQSPICESGSSVCYCKANVEGNECNQCKAGTFKLSQDNPRGCTSCYCSGVTNKCSEAKNLYLQQIPCAIFDDSHGFTLTNLDQSNNINSNFQLNVPLNQIGYRFGPDAFPERLFWALPSQFLGNKITSYGGNLKITQKFESRYQQEYSTSDMDVVLVGNDMTIYWKNDEPIPAFQTVSYTVPLIETKWSTYEIREAPRSVSRDDLLSVLANLRHILVRATLSDYVTATFIADIAMDTTYSRETGQPLAENIEVCRCPSGYSGLSCESCSVGYYRDQDGACNRCPCSGNEEACSLDSYGGVSCACKPTFYGPDCSRYSDDIDNEVTATENPEPIPPPTIRVTISEPTIQIKEIGSTVQFSCYASSNRSPRPLSIRWDKERGDLPSRAITDDNRGLLTIHRVIESDSGTYICTASDGESIGTSRATLKVPGNDPTIPQVTLTPSVLEVQEGERIELRCEATGNPAPNIQWTRIGRRLINKNHVHKDGVLSINYALLTDQGEYRCLATNSAGDDYRTVNVRVTRRRFPESRYVLRVNPNYLRFSEGEDVTVSCYSTPEIDANLISWSRDGGFLPSHFQSVKGQLKIESIGVEDTGTYICSAEGSLERIPPIRVEIVVQRQPLIPSSPGRVKVDFESKTVVEGEYLSINCIPSGNPLPYIKWTKRDSDFERGTTQRGNALIISQAKWEDRGRYVCLGVINDDFVDETSVEIIVERREIPVVEITPSNYVNVIEGSKVTVQCRIQSGIPEPVLLWSRPGRTLGRNAKLLPGGILNIIDFDINDEGLYICSANNLAGEGSANITFKMYTYPTMQVHPYSPIVVRQGSNATVMCQAEGIPRPLVHWRMESPKFRTVTGESYDISILNLTNVYEDETYECIATNEVGTNRVTTVIRVDDGPQRGDRPEDIIEEELDSSETEMNYLPSDEYIERRNESDTFQLRCSSRPTDVVRWVRNDGALPYNTRQRGDILEFINVTKADAGYYECYVTSEAGTLLTRNRVLLKVQSPPRITLHPQIQTVRPGDIANLKCSATGDEPMTIQWMPASGSFPSHVAQSDGHLVFDGIKINDAGRYICIAQNPVASSHAVAEVIVNEEGGATHEAKVNRIQRIAANLKVSLCCGVADGVRHNGITWTKNGGSLPPYARLDTSTLVFERVQPRDAGHYECQVKNVGGVITKDYVDLIVAEPVLNSVLISPQELTSREGDRVNVECKTTGENFNLRWSKESSREVFYTIPIPGGLNLEIESVRPSDSGTYRCEGRDRSGTLYYADFTLRVIPDGRRSINNLDIQQDAPEIYSAPLGSNVEIPCTTDMPGPVKFQWERPYVKFPMGLKNESLNEPNLILSSIDENDAGTYTCKTSNGRSQADKKIFLKITNVVPRFNGEGYIELKTLQDVYYYLDIEIAIKPQGANGLILYNSQKSGKESGDYVLLELVDGVPEFKFSFGSTPTVLRSDRRLELNEWHIINLSRIRKDVYMKIDGNSPLMGESSGRQIGLDLEEPLYIGGVPNLDDMPNEFISKSGFVGCIGRLGLEKQEISLMKEAEFKENVLECDSCSGNNCQNNAVCQDASTERGYTCLCLEGYSGLDCSQTGDACRPGLCGPGKCSDTVDGFKCTCPIGFIGDRCESSLDIEYPAFGGAAYIAYSPPKTQRLFKMGLRIKPRHPIVDGIILYCAESRQGHGDFASLTVKDGYLEFRYDTGTGPVILKSPKRLVADEWVAVNITKFEKRGTLQVEGQELRTISSPSSPKQTLNLKTPLYVGGYDDEWLTINKGTGVNTGFSGCITDFLVHGNKLDIVKSPIQSANIRECSDDDESRNELERGDIYPEASLPPNGDVCSRCVNGGWCTEYNANQCNCPSGYQGQYCEIAIDSLNPNNPYDPCEVQPCQGNGTCRPLRSGLFKCDCPLGTGGFNCRDRVDLRNEVSFSGEGYVELPASLLRHSNDLSYDAQPEVIAIAFDTNEPDGLLLYQKENGRNGDFIMLNINGGFVEFQYDLGSGLTTVQNTRVQVTDGQYHRVIVRRSGSRAILEVDGNEEQGEAPGLTQLLNANSNIYIGGLPSEMSSSRIIGFNGCIHQVEFSEANIINFGRTAIASRNANPCSNSLSQGSPLFWEQFDAVESPPPVYIPHPHHFYPRPSSSSNLGDKQLELGFRLNN